MKRIIFTSLISILTLLFFIACDKDKDTIPDEIAYTDLSANVQSIIPEEILDSIISLGMPINKGINPPSMESSYLASPFILRSSNRASDAIGQLFADYKFKLYDQNNSTLTIQVDYVNGPERGSGLGGFISGNDNNFTIYAEINSTTYGDDADLVHIISGTIVNGGISNLYFANLMVNNYGNTYGYWIEEGEGRVIYDQDGFSEVILSINTLKTVSNRETGASMK